MSRAERLSFDVSPAFALAAALIYLLDEQGLFALMVISAAVHELGHFAALCLFGAPPWLLRLELTGAAMYFDEQRLSYGQEIIAAAAGPMAGLLLSFAAAFGGAHALAGVSLMLSVFNLLPIGGLDGGRMLHAVLALLTDSQRAGRACFAVTLTAASAMLVTGAALMIHSRSGSALILAGAVLLIKLKRTP